MREPALGRQLPSIAGTAAEHARGQLRERDHDHEHTET